MSGISDQIIGKAKQAAGSVNGDEKLKNEGKGQEAKGKLEQKVDELGDKVSHVVDDLKKKVDNK